jgi:hypothetical protein
MPLDLHRRQGGSFNPPWFGVAPGDALTFAGVPLLLGVVSVLSASLPARRAALIDPAGALRTEQRLGRTRADWQTRANVAADLLALCEPAWAIRRSDESRRIEVRRWGFDALRQWLSFSPR